MGTALYQTMRPFGIRGKYISRDRKYLASVFQRQIGRYQRTRPFIGFDNQGAMRRSSDQTVPLGKVLPEGRGIGREFGKDHTSAAYYFFR